MLKVKEKDHSLAASFQKITDQLLRGEILTTDDSVCRLETPLINIPMDDEHELIGSFHMFASITFIPGSVYAGESDVKG